MNHNDQNYKRLHEVSRNSRILQGITSILDWDQETYMPSDATAIRSEQLKVMAGIVHKSKTGRPFANALGKLIDIESGKILAPSLPPEQQAALLRWRRDYRIDKALPKRFVENWAKLSSQAMHTWQHARQQDAFQQFAPFLEKLVSMARKKADLLGYKVHPYDALLDLYEQDFDTTHLDVLFGSLRTSVSQLMKKIVAEQNADDHFLFGEFSHDQQVKFSHLLLKAMHYDMSKGRLDFSAHPFSSSSHPTDSRITTRIHPKSVMSNISAVMHEAGHAFYEMGLPVEQYGSPLGESISLGVHESQSRWWETRIGLSKPFWKHFLPLLQEHFKGQLSGISLDQFYRAINKVEPSLIRIESDEVTYSLHIILRYELEKALIEGSMKVRDIPEAWNAKMQELLGIRPPNNREGCLQDIHWSMGAFGYFPSYTLGNLYCAHLFTKFEKDNPNWEERVAKGELLFIKEWLNKEVHKHGRRYTSKELMEKVVGKPFTADAYLNYLQKKYTKSSS